MDVDLVGTSLAFPKVCSCCGEPTQATRMVGHTRRSGRAAYMTRWTVPACERCSRHIEEANWGGPIAVLLFFVALGSFGLLSPLLWLWRRHKLASAAALCGPQCGGYAGMTYVPIPVPGGGGHGFRGAHRVFVQQLVLANPRAVHAPSAEVLAMLPR